jgi:hypothetical protein
VLVLVLVLVLLVLLVLVPGLGLELGLGLGLRLRLRLGLGLGLVGRGLGPGLGLGLGLLGVLPPPMPGQTCWSVPWVLELHTIHETILSQVGEGKWDERWEEGFSTPTIHNRCKDQDTQELELRRVHMKFGHRDYLRSLPSK